MDLVGEYVRLTKKGRNYWGLCPFHSRKDPLLFRLARTSRSSSASAAARAAGPSTSSWSWTACPSGTRWECWPSGWNLEVPDTGGFSAGMKERREKLLTINKAGGPGLPQVAVRPGGGGGAGLPSEARAEPGDPDPVRPGLRPRPLGRSASTALAEQGYDKAGPAGRRAGGEQQGRPHL